MIEGRYTLSRMDAGLAGDPIVRQQLISQVRAALGEESDLIVIAVPAGTSEEVRQAIAPVLDGDAGESRTISEGTL